MDEDIFYGDDFGGLEDIDEDMLRAYLEGLLLLSPVMTKPVFAICEQQRRRSTCASMQSNQHFCCLHSG